MTLTYFNLQGPKNLPDSLSGAENNNRITNSEEQQLVDDEVTEADVSTLPEKTEERLSSTDQKEEDAGIFS